MVVSLNYCSQNGGNLYRAPHWEPKYRSPYYREFRPIPIYALAIPSPRCILSVSPLLLRVIGRYILSFKQDEHIKLNMASFIGRRTLDPRRKRPVSLQVHSAQVWQANLDSLAAHANSPSADVRVHVPGWFGSRSKP